jgi:stage III sporulation protein AF
MTEFIGQWITSITCAAMLTAVLQAFLPQNGMGKAGKLVGGLVLLTATVQPLVSLDEDILAQSWAELTQTAVSQTSASEAVNQEALKMLIEQQTQAYILDKAEELGIVCQVDVSYEQAEDGTVFLSEVNVVSGASQEELEQLASLIETELGVPRGRQVYERTAS